MKARLFLLPLSKGRAMKLRVILIISLLALLAVSFAAADKPSARSPLEGTWEMTSAKWTENGKVMSMPGDGSGTQLKMYSKGYFIFVGRFTERGKAPIDSYGGGTYTLNGKDYTETILYHTTGAIVGKTFHFKLVIAGDTMTLTGPIPTEEQKEFRSQFTEVYRRKD
jgi:hypothetical protein